jgi:hypothetical protein
MAKKETAPDLVILNADFVLSRNGVLMTWPAGKTITAQRDIDMLIEHDAPANYYVKVSQ